MTINNPTEFRFNHDRLRANNVVIIPTPTNNSNLNSIMESNNDFNKYYNFGNYTDVRYRRILSYCLVLFTLLAGVTINPISKAKYLDFTNYNEKNHEYRITKNEN